jgi:hypothetical protein
VRPPTRGTVPTEYQEMSDRYAVMSTDDLLRVADDPKSLTIAAREALGDELRKRYLDSPDAIAKYEHEREQHITQEKEQAAAVRQSKRSRFQRVFDHLRDHPMAALLACVGFPASAFLIGYGMVTLRVGNGRILSFLVSLMLALGGVCGVAAARSQARLPIRILGFLAALGEFFYAFVFLFSGTVGFG